MPFFDIGQIHSWAPMPNPLHTGSKVVILQGLAKAPHLNGKTGTVAAAVDAATGTALGVC